MRLQEAKDLLDPYEIIILHDNILKLYKVFLNSATLYITEKMMESYDEEEFKNLMLEAFMQDAVMTIKGPRPHLH